MLLLVPVVAAAGCADAHHPDVERVAESFAGGDATGRCSLLAPATRQAVEDAERAGCPAALAEVPLGSGAVESVAVWGTDAQVRLVDDTLFLTLSDSGWLVSAAACTPPSGEGPYDCRLEPA